MVVLTAETCWALNEYWIYNKISGIKLVSLYSTYMFVIVVLIMIMIKNYLIWKIFVCTIHQISHEVCASAVLLFQIIPDRKFTRNMSSKSELLYIPHVHTLNVVCKEIENSTKLGRPSVRSLKINHELFESLAGETERVFTWSCCCRGIFLLETIQKMILATE